MNSRNLTMIGAAVAMGTLGLTAAYAQFHPMNGNKSNQYPGTMKDIPAAMHATVKDAEGKLPDSSRVTALQAKDLKWAPNGPAGTKPGEADVTKVYGDMTKPGPYAVFYRWHPGAFSRPHFHDKIRHVVVVSGTWWVSSSTTYDEKTTYPLHAGDTGTDLPMGIHWDGARTGEKEPAVIYLYGEGPVSTVFVDTKGKPIPLEAAAKK